MNKIQIVQGIGESLGTSISNFTFPMDCELVVHFKHFLNCIYPVMLTKPQPYEAEAATHGAEAKTNKAEVRFSGLEAEFEAKFMRRQRFEKLKNL